MEQTAAMDDTAIAFEMPYVRAAATAAGASVDRISVRDYTRDVEIGAFRVERGVTQRIRFNVVLEVAHLEAARDDDVDRVLSYETIVDAIEAALAAERFNLLETLAERVAQGCLDDPRAARVFVRIEKLDRIPGALGVEIARTRPAAADPARSRACAGVRPLVMAIGRATLEGPDGGAWLDAVAAAPRPIVVCPAPGAPQPAAISEAALRVGLLALDAAAWTLLDRDPRLTVTATRAELDWALRSGRRAVWAPSKMVTDAQPRPPLDASRPAALAAWLAAGIGAEALVLAGADLDEPPVGLAVRLCARPTDLTE